MTVLAPQVPIAIPEKLLPILQPKRFKIMRGGRGGAKSHTVAQVLPAMGLQRPLRIVCAREVQKSLKQSSMAVLKDYIRTLGLSPYYEALSAEIRSRINATTFEFMGLREHTVDTIKSYEGADIVWIEEAHKVSSHSWNILIPTIRKAGSEIWATFNPDQETDYVYDRFVKHTDPDAWVVEINWRDNPWFPPILETERVKLQAINEDLYQHVWEGKCRSVAGLLFKRAWFKRYPLGKHPERLNLYIASDYAGGPDPDDPDADPDHTEHGCAGLDDGGDLWFVDWWSGQEDPAVWIRAWLAMIRRNKAPDRPLIAFEEKGVIRRTLDGAINKAMREEKTFIHREGLPSAGSKASRALGFAARASAGTVWIPECEWGDRLVNQLCAFNGQDGRIDDMVDVCSLLARGLDVMTDPPAPPPPRPTAPEPFTADWFALRDKRDALDEAERARYYR
jgi:hypothetical protein